MRGGRAWDEETEDLRFRVEGTAMRDEGFGFRLGEDKWVNGVRVDSLCFTTRVLLTEPKVESGDVSKQKRNLS